MVAIYETAHWLGSKGVEKVHGMNKGGTLELGGAAFTMTHAIHSCGIADGAQIIYGGEAAGYVVRAEGRVFYFAGDTAVFSDMALIGEIYQPQLAFLPIGDLYTMGPREAAVACRLLQAPRVVPALRHVPSPGTPAAAAGLAPGRVGRSQAIPLSGSASPRYRRGTATYMDAPRRLISNSGGRAPDFCNWVTTSEVVRTGWRFTS